ncbi:MAG: response regulator transcription factor [Chloroflexales bacterium]|nr:response regulator transcription factor [Chloroflexales bacterium]
MVDQRTVRVLTLDSLPVIHAGVGQLLAAFSDIKLVGHAYSLAEAQELGARFRPDIALVEIGDLGVAWPEALAGLARALPGVPLVVFTMTVEVDALRHTLRAGVQGYLLKNTDALSLAQALRAAAAGRTVFAPEAWEVVVALHRDAEPGTALLSPREREVLTLLALGLSNDEIAVRLHISISTVKYHCRTLFQKLYVATRGQAVAKAYAARLVPLMCSEAEPAQRRSEPGARLALVRRA